MLTEKYNRFRAHPSGDDVTDDCSVAYVASGCVFSGKQRVLEHYAKNEFEVSERETVICRHETGPGRVGGGVEAGAEASTEAGAEAGSRTLILETSTVVKFLRGPGAYLPGFSLNFVADQEVTISLTHIVEFDLAGVITAIRLLWDQASVLKKLNIIGSRGNAWPISLGDSQSDLVKRQVSRQLHSKDSDSFTPSTLSPRQESPFKAWPASINVFDSQALDPVPVRSPLAQPSPTPRGFYSNNRPFRTSTARTRPQSAVFSLFGETD